MTDVTEPNEPQDRGGAAEEPQTPSMEEALQEALHASGGVPEGTEAPEPPEAPTAGEAPAPPTGATEPEATPTPATIPATGEPAAATEPPSGPTLLADRYEVGDLTGRTAMLETFSGRDRILGTAVDIKFLSPQLAEDAAFADRFVEEAKAAMAIDHTNVVKVLDAGATADRRYIVLEHTEGRTLQQILKSEGPLTAERAANITTQVCTALQAAHVHHIVHGDINPGVVVVGDGDRVKVSEFGVARVESPQTVAQTRAIMGTAAYLSPEQAQGEQADGRSDIYSTAIVLYEMIAGSPPFTADSPVALAYMHVRDTAKPLAEVRTDTPQRVADATMEALSKKPADRFQDAASFAAALSAPATPLAPESKGGGDLAPATMVFSGSRGGGGGLTSRTKLVIGVVAAALAFLALYAFLLMPRNVRVPTLINMSQEQAIQTLEDVGLGSKVLLQASNEVAPGTVFGQAPAAAQVVREGTTVVITVAEAPSNITVPNVVGLSQADAQAQLERAGLSVGTVSQEASETAPAGTVLSQDPAAGTLLPGATAVDITIAQLEGPAIVPNVTCNTPDRAATVLDESGLQMTVAGVETDPDFMAICPMDGKPRITQTNPPAGTQVAEGAIIQVWTTVAIPSSAPASPVSPPPASPASPFASPVTTATTSPLP